MENLIVKGITDNEKITLEGSGIFERLFTVR